MKIILATLIIFCFSCKKEKDSEPLPFIDFTHSVSASAPTVVSFTAQPSSEGEIKWDFGDGSTANGNPVTHTYGSKGIYKAYVQLISASGNAMREKTIIATDVKKMSIVNVEATVPSTNSSGIAWDSEVGATNPDLFVRIYGPTGNQVIPGSPIYFNNALSMNYNLNPVAEIMNFEQVLTCKLYDHDSNSDEQIGAFTFDFLKSNIDAVSIKTYDLPRLSGAGTMKIRVEWSL